MRDEFTIVLLRHGESVGNAEGYHQGQYDFPLSERGRQQARRLLNRWQVEKVAFDQVIASPLKRARETVEIVAGGLNLPVEFDPEWMERHNGALSGLKVEIARELYPPPSFYNPYGTIVGGGEGNWELYMRAGRALLKLMRRPPAKYLVISHGGILNQVVAAILETTHQANGQGVRFSFGNTAFATFKYRPGTHEWIVCGINDRAHLTGIEGDHE
jgi:2,3-bisphosphoglycerate-dependent phosphoglycerate mutase